MGHRDYVEEEARNARLQITQADGNVRFVPINQREDPDLTDHENISHIILNEDLVEQSARKKVKLVTSSQQDNVVPPNSVELENGQAEDEPIDENYATLNPDDVSQYLYVVESGSQVDDANVGHRSVVQTSSDPISAQPHNANVEFEQPKGTSTPANRKLKRAKAIHPDEITEMEVRRADLEASVSIKQAADKIMEAATMIVNCMQDLRLELKLLANRNYREIQMSSNAVKQLVSGS